MLIDTLDTLVDTHCHLNMMIKSDFEVPITDQMVEDAQQIVHQAQKWGVNCVVNVGTSLIESKNSVVLAQQINHVYATVGIHPNDCTDQWRSEFKELERLVKQKDTTHVVGVGETGIDRHYAGYDLQRQVDAFKAHIELALEYDCALIVHSREAYDETLRVIEEYAKHMPRGVMHCFSYDQTFAQQVVQWGFVVGIGGTVTYPKNDELRLVVQKLSLKHIVLETDAPFLPPQHIRGKRNHPKEIKTIAEYIAQLRSEPYREVAKQTTKNAAVLFDITI